MDTLLGNLDAAHLSALALIGLFAGLAGGALGIGGGLIMIPAMVLVLGDQCYGPNTFHLYKLAALVTAIALSLSAIRQHARAGAIVKRMIPGIVVFGLLGVVGGVLIAQFFAGPRTILLRRAFGVFMMLSVLVSLWRQRFNPAAAGRPDHSPTSARWLHIGLLVGFPSGLISGLLGVGGGIWAVPVQNALLGINLRNAVANSACMIVGVAAGASVAQSVAIINMEHASLGPGWGLAVCLLPGAVIGAWIGGRLTHVVPVGLLRNLFYVVLVVTGVRLIGT